MKKIIIKGGSKGTVKIEVTAENAHTIEIDVTIKAFNIDVTTITIKKGQPTWIIINNFEDLINIKAISDNKSKVTAENANEI